MAIVCKECKVGVAIAKFYPHDTNGWWSIPERNEKIDNFFEKHGHDYDASTWGGEQYYLGYEMDDNDWTYAE